MTYDKTSKNKILTYAKKYTKTSAIKKFDISRSTLYAWLKELEPDYIKPERKSFFRKVDPELLEIYVQENPNMTCEQIGQYFDVSGTAINKALEKLGFSFKKRNFSTKNVMKNKEKNTKKRSEK